MICSKCLEHPTARGIKCVRCVFCGEEYLANVLHTNICKECSDKRKICQCCGDFTSEQKISFTNGSEITIVPRSIFDKHNARGLQ